MTILDDLTGGPFVRADRADADKAALAAAVHQSTRTQAGRRGNHRLLSLSVRGTIAGIAAAGLLAGGATAAVLLTSQRPTVLDQARCYTEASTNFTPSFPGTSVAEASPAGAGSGTVDVADQAVEACAAVWRQGLVTYGSPGVVAGDGIPDHPVPALTACVLPSGEAAVFPGSGAGTCRRLGLPPMAGQDTHSTQAP